MRILLSLSIALIGSLMLSTVGHSETVQNKKTELHCSNHELIVIDSLELFSFDLTVKNVDSLPICTETTEGSDNPKTPDEGYPGRGILVIERFYRHPLLFTDAYKLYSQPLINNCYLIRNKSNI